MLRSDQSIFSESPFAAPAVDNQRLTVPVDKRHVSSLVNPCGARTIRKEDNFPVSNGVMILTA